MPAKFIVSAEAPRRALWERMLAYGRKGDALHDQISLGGQPEAILCKRDAAALAATLRKLAGSPAMSKPGFGPTRARLQHLASKIDDAAPHLHD